MCIEEQNWLEVMNLQQWMKQIQETNQYTLKYGLRLSEEDTEILIE
ncbi:hypothetical protein [Lacrimispora amygdalina]|nr:hypothetical protein [Lacrimispora amygdalina]